MRKVTLIITAITFMMVSCTKPEEEWDRFYGFTQEDIVGHYEANPDESLYEELPAGMVIYDNASIDVTATGTVSVSLHIVIPSVINKQFSGTIDMQDEQRSDLILRNNNGEDVMMTVYKNENGRVRFHGRVKHYGPQNNPYVGDVNWGFDVLKEQ